MSSNEDDHTHDADHAPARVVVALHWDEDTDTTEHYIEPSAGLCPHCTTHILHLDKCCRGEGIEHVESAADLEVLPEHVIKTITEIEVHGEWQDAVEFTLHWASDMPMLNLISFHSYDDTYPCFFPEGLQIDGVPATTLTAEDPFDGHGEMHGVDYALKVWFTYEEKTVGYAVLRWKGDKMVLDGLELEEVEGGVEERAEAEAEAPE
ncbi:hypothetical protein LTR10_024106 [Elasticomyces elasticus]|uniref:Uncharacterized protein n=1 Tax=Exophiala sideris TaxID=1016849 RepID=A0ABR0JP89_9EURO|nr:hypothetical protein LTR10_024106 [Elasticomyces elasticus]KAK5038311.1 hypothetical protein LTS07_001781 [Exophiala sideris]KAK5044295.1 hypothetical protein LTR13_000651 [Exophiala sideris]KAK5067795.1 hypothetical protein LTR69_001784 [Exophiala sideris]KAK5183965.1 hypothetical protein LTR44_003470 [Eurotiomycetes sp. CCFEE 6388]